MWFEAISPYLFVIGMEALSCLIAKVVEGGFLYGCRFEGREGDGLTVSNLSYANDTILFCESKQEQMGYLSWLLMWFEAISGLKINLAKSKIILVGGVVNMEVLANELGCNIGAFPSSYLGLPLGAQHNSMADWGCYRGKVSEKFDFVEDIVYLKRGETHSPL